MKTITTALSLSVLAAWPVQAVPLSEELKIEESLNAFVIHGGPPRCSSGWHMVAGTCFSDDVKVPEVSLPEVKYSGSYQGSEYGGPLSPSPEPGTLLLLGTALAGIGIATRRRIVGWFSDTSSSD